MMQSPPGQGAANLGYARVVLDYLAERGIDAAEVFGASWLHDALGEGSGQTELDNTPRQRLPIDQWQWMLHRVTEHLNDEALPVRLGAAVRPRHTGLLGFLLMSCDTIGAAAAILQRYELLLDSANEAVCVPHADRVDIEWRALIDAPSPHLIQLAMTIWVCQARWLSERPDLVSDVAFSFDAPRDAQALACYQQAFGGTVRFNQPVNKLTFPLSYLSIPIVQRNPAVHDLLRVQAEAELMEIASQRGDFLGRLEVLLAERLDGGACTLGSIAEALDLTPRTLQHRLDEHGVNFRALLDRVRSRLADQHLRNPALSLSEVAMMLGFADQSAFQHAFKRWKGLSPGEYRRAILSAV